MQIQSSINFSIDIESIKMIPFDKYEEDFTFIVNGKEFKTCRLIADILSPRIRNYHYIDETIDKFFINLCDFGSECDFHDILSLASFEAKEIKEDQINFYRNIFFILDNRNEFMKLIPKDDTEITLENVFDRIQLKPKFYKIINDYEIADKRNNYQPEISKEYLGITTEQDLFKDEIEFISSHFYEIEIEKIKKLEISIIEGIIKSDKLQLKDEDSLIKFIIEIYSKDHQYSYLFEYVDFFNVSEEELQNFYKIFDLNDLNKQIWKLIVERTLVPNNGKINQRKNHQRYNEQIEGIPFYHKKGQEFNGVIKYLNEKTGGNIHDNGTIEITSNSYYSGDHPKNLVDFDDKTKYESPRSDAWICFDFKKMKIKLTGYSIKSFEGEKNDCHLKSWDIEVSDDGENWNVIDQHKNCSTLNGNWFVDTFYIQSNDFSNYVRIRQTDEPWGGDYLKICCIEFFGFLKV